MATPKMHIFPCGGKPRAYAVSNEPVSRDTAYSPRSNNWTLYDPAKVAEKLGVPTEDVDRALEETGFYKAVRIREELIRWKERLREEERAIQGRLAELSDERRKLGQRRAAIREDLQNIRNMLRLPREKGEE